MQNPICILSGFSWTDKSTEKVIGFIAEAEKSLWSVTLV